jgi:hypothetical protein
MKWTLGGILALLIVLGARQAIQDSYTDTMDAVTKGGPATCLEVRGSTTAEEGGRTYIIGNLRNNCNRAVGQATVVFSVDRGGTMYAYVRDLKVGETRRFKTMFPISQNQTYHFESINAF